MCHMRRDVWIHARDPDGSTWQAVQLIARASSTPANRQPDSAVTRALLAEAIEARRAACNAGLHLGTVRDGLCGHCGGTA